MGKLVSLNKGKKEFNPVESMGEYLSKMFGARIEAEEIQSNDGDESCYVYQLETDDTVSSVFIHFTQESFEKTMRLCLEYILYMHEDFGIKSLGDTCVHLHLYAHRSPVIDYLRRELMSILSELGDTKTLTRIHKELSKELSKLNNR